MTKIIQALIVEDSLEEAELIIWELRSRGFEVRHRIVASATQLRTALTEEPWDIILSSSMLAEFSALAALGILRETQSDVPLLVIADAVDSAAVTRAIEAGARDVISKSRLSRLGPAVEREMLECGIRRERRRAEDIEKQHRSDRQQAEDHIRKQARLLDLAQDAILVCDLNDLVRYWNQGAERLYGWTAQEILGRNAAEVLFGRSPLFLAAKQQVLDKGDWSGECGQIGKLGQEIVVNSRWTVVRDPDQGPESILILNTDLTEKKRLEAQFLHAQRLESIGTMASGIAHDLNNILSPILMAGEMLRARALDPESRHLLSMIEANAQHGAEIVAQMLNFSRRVAGKKDWLQSRQLITDTVDLTSRTFPKTIRVHSDDPPDLSPVLGDATQLHQVLLNLCLNARDAMPSGGTLKITGQNIVLDSSYASMVPGAKSGAYVLFEVADTGVGIPAEVIEKIFDPFFTTKGEGQGTGLGLSSVLGIVKSHGGFVEVRSARGRGTAFRVFLPAKPESTVADHLRERPLIPLGSGEWILLVDDSSDIREITQSSLSAHGYRVMGAADGVEALVLFARHLAEIQLVITDVEMPVMDGLALIRAVRKMEPNIRVMVTGGNLDKARTSNELQTLNVQTILAKPYTSEELLLAVHAALGRY